MKKVLFLGVVLSVSSVASEPRKDPFPDQNLSCVVTSDNKRYHDIFLIEVRESGFSRLSYKRIHLASPRDSDGNFKYGDWEPVRGCYQGVQTRNEHHPHHLNIECRNHGEDGSITLFQPQGESALEGEIYFYKPQLGYPERTMLEIRCERVNLGLSKPLSWSRRGPGLLSGRGWQDLRT